MMHVSSKSTCLLLWMASFISGLDAGFKFGFLPRIFDYSYFQREYQKSNNTDNTYRSKLFLGRTLGIFKHNILFLQRKSNYYLAQNAMTDLTPDEIAKQQGSGPDFDLKPVIEAEEFGGLPANFLKSIQKITESDATTGPPSDIHGGSPGDGLAKAIDQMNEDYMTIEATAGETTKPSTKTSTADIESESAAVKVSKVADQGSEEKIEYPSDQIRSSYSSSVGNLLGIGVGKGGGGGDDGEFSEIEKALERMDEDYMSPGAAAPKSNPVDEEISDPKIVKVSKIDDPNEVRSANEHSVEQLMASFSNSVENLLGEDDDERIKKDPGQVMNPETVVSQAPIKYRIDWRITGCIGRPRAQGTCNACYIFATLDLLEYFYCRQTGNKAQFSRQHVLDCGTESGAIKGCQGGRLSEVGKFVRSHGLRFESSHPFTGKRGECKSLDGDHEDKQTTVVMPDIINWQLFNSITAWYTWARKSPIIVGINMPSDFHVYGGGIHDGRNCQINETHAMLLVGYGSQAGLEFWLLKNSFSEDWGEAGYFRLSKDAPLNCFGSAIVARAAFDSR